MTSIRPLTGGDEDAIRDFFARIPEADRRFFRENVSEAGTVQRWLEDTGAVRLVAVDDEGKVRGYEAIVPGIGWSSHVGDLRVIVDPDFRGRGVGSRLVRKAVLMAERMGVTKLMVEVIANQGGTVATFRALGFQPEALLRDHVRDRDGVTHDLMLLVHAADENEALLLAMGLNEALS
jgi:ribosomal protein S18 acetylase RimI-like enzyme